MTLAIPPRWAHELIELLDAQRRIYLSLHELAMRQGQLVAAGDAEPLLTLLAQRQSLIDQLTQANGRIEPYRREWPTLWPQLDTVARARIQGFVNEIQDVLDRIVEQDERDRLALSVHRGRVAEELRHVSRGSTINRAYGRPNVNDANRYTDRQG